MIYSKVEGSGKPFLIIHGFLGMSDNWKTLSTQFAAEGFEMHLLDMRNHGRSFHSDVFNYEVMVQDVLEYVNDKNLDKFILLGHSMGGKVAMNFACDYPERVGKLLVADISPREYAPHHQDVMEALNAVDFSAVTSRKEIEDMMSKYIKDFGTLQFLMKNVHRVTSDSFGFRFNLEAFNNDESVIGEALSLDKKYSGKTLFLKGGRSKYIQESDYNDIQNHFPNSIIETVSNSGHWLHAENPNEFFIKVNDFICDK